MNEVECVSKNQSSCQVCGVLLEIKETGRPKQFCDDCRKKHRKQYEQEYWVAHHPMVHKRPKAKVEDLLTVKSKPGERRGLLTDLKAYRHSLQSRKERNRGGSGYSEVMPSYVDHSLYSARQKQLKLKTTRVCFHLDFTNNQTHVLTEPLSGSDPWGFYLYEFNRQLRMRRLSFC